MGAIGSLRRHERRDACCSQPSTGEYDNPRAAAPHELGKFRRTD
ncbi:hypothetical protein [Kribbella sp. NPDC050459]